MQRKNAILLAANHHFAHHGFRGASLRDIARDAQVSLTLLNHHFGSKYQLLSAVIDSHRAMLDERASALAQLMIAGPGKFSARDLVQVWIRIGFDAAAAEDGENFLRLMARVIDDPSEEAAQVVREKLDDAALVFIDALQLCYPRASRYAAASAYICVSASLLKFLVGSKRLFRLAHAASPQETAYDDQERLTRFLVAGIEAALRPAADSTTRPTLATGHDGASRPDGAANQDGADGADKPDGADTPEAMGWPEGVDRPGAARQ
ncbi:MAG: TetR/AcrR family transcriptional regulator [Vitreoscilla sp.]